MSDNSKFIQEKLSNTTHFNGAVFPQSTTQASPLTPDPFGEQEKLLSMHEASRMTGYHQDYLGQVARSGKLKAKKMGRNWFTTKLAIDMFLGRVPAAPAVAVQAAPVQAAPAVMKVSAAPAAATSAAPVAKVEPIAVSQPAVAPAPMRPTPRITIEKFVAPVQQAPKVTEPARRQIAVNILSVSPDAGPNLQEAIAVPAPEAVRLPATVGLENKNTFHRLNKLVASRNIPESRREPVQKKFVSGGVLRRTFSFPAFVGMSVLLIAAAVGSAYYFSGEFADGDRQPQMEQVAGVSTSAAGRGKILAGQSEAVVTNDSIDANSVIMISFRADQPGRYWVTGLSSGKFILKLNEPAAEDLSFDYWVAADIPPGPDDAGEGTEP